ncbi:MAG TPA: class I SAM-dependent rRNA methyltransferase [Gemmatimonadaceae bacterium]|nr:class I SAM-dependent rRNA methyltransferase [Gemmatimonadaceae bacterium]
MNVPDPAVGIVSAAGARRWDGGHPWIFRGDVRQAPTGEAGPVAVHDARGKPLGMALWSPSSEIAFRRLDIDPDAHIDASWWAARIARASERRDPVAVSSNAYRVVHAEADGCPSLIVDRYGAYLVVQLLSAGLDACRTEIIEALVESLAPDGILARNDASVRGREGLPRLVEALVGTVPREIAVEEHGVRYLAAPHDGQKTGAFLDQRENRVRIGSMARGEALDCFSYHGSFALHLARTAERVTALDSSESALTRAASNAALNHLTNVRFVEANAFEWLRDAERRGERYETIVLDPPAFAKSRASVTSALRGYKEINLRAIRLLASGGVLFTASCSYHITKPLFLEMLQAAASDAGRRLALVELRGQPLDHPEVLTIPETGYLKGAIIEAMD